MRELGTTIDLHGGGSDLIFPHHECETAQSEAATGELFVRHWVHTGMVRYEGTKMSKSLGNLVFVRDLLKTWDPAAIRLAVLAHHYRSDWDWHEQLLPEAVTRLSRWRAAIANSAGCRAGPPRGTTAQGTEGGVLAEVRAALDDDLDTPRALAAIDAAAGSGERPAPDGRVDVENGPIEAIKAAAALLGVHL